MPLKKVKWGNLLGLIENRLVVPVVGPELSVISIGGRSLSLYDAVADELIRTLEWSDEAPAPGSDLNTVVRTYLQDPDNKPRQLYVSVHNILTKPKQPWPTPEPLRKLAAIGHFDVFVSITCDVLLEQAINEVRFGGAAKTLSRSYSTGRPSAECDLPISYKAAYSGTDRPPKVPAVFHILGTSGVVETDFALREEDLLRFYQCMQSSDRRPANLFDVLNGRDMLMLGSGFHGWVTRFFLATTKQEKLFAGQASGVLADQYSPKNNDLILFLERNGTHVFEGDSIAFVDELHRRWTEKFPEGVPALDGGADAQPETPELRENVIFISYAREDQNYAKAIRDALTMENLQVWFDERSLEPGDDFKLKILQAIEQCSVFVPVISRAALSASSRFLYREWNTAQDRKQEFKPGSRFIQPVIVDDSSATDLPEFRDFISDNFVRLEDGKVPTSFVESMKRTIRELRSKATSR
jgi:hypothetical protein